MTARVLFMAIVFLWLSMTLFCATIAHIWCFCPTTGPCKVCNAVMSLLGVTK